MLDPTMMNSQLQPTPPAIPTPAAMPEDGKIKAALTNLPKGISQGDTVTFKVASLDHESAYLEPEDAPDAAPMDPNHDNEDEKADDGEESDEPGMDTKTLLGPMNGLKNYLVQKSMDVPKNQGR